MRLTDRLNLPQRIVLVIAIGIALAAIGVYLANRGSMMHSLHYFSASRIEPVSPLPGWLRLIVWLVLDAIWSVASLVMLRPSQGSVGPH